MHSHNGSPNRTDVMPQFRLPVSLLHTQSDKAIWVWLLV